MNINEPPRASRPALPRRACRAWASSSDPVGLLQAPVCPTKLIAPRSTSLPAAPSLRSPPRGSTQGVKISGSPRLLGGAEEAPIKVLTGKETRAYSGLGRRKPPRSRPPRPASHTPGNAVATLARAILSTEPDAAGPGGRRGAGGGESGREASLGSAPGGRKPQISHRSARRSRVRPGTGRAGVGPARPDSRGRGAAARAPRPHPRARSARLDGLSGTRTAEILLSVQGQDRNSASGVLRTGNFSLTRCRPSPTPASKQNRNPAPAANAPRLGPPPPAPLRRLGDPRVSAPARGGGGGGEEFPGPRAPVAANKQARRAGLARAPPRAPGCHPPGPGVGSGGGADRGRFRALSGDEPRGAALRSCGSQAGSAAPRGEGGAEAVRRRRLGESRCGDSGGLRARPGKVPVETPCLETPAALREGGGGGRRTRRAQRGAVRTVLPLPRRGLSADPQPNGKPGGWGRPATGLFFCLCPSLLHTHTRKFLNRFIY